MSLNIYKSIFCMAALSLLYSCKKFTEIDPPKNAISTELVFADEQSANSAVLGVYSMMSAEGFGFGDVTLNAGISADELVTLDISIDKSTIFTNNIRPTNGIVLGLWVSGYRIIGQANACIDGLNQSTSISTDKKNQLIAECRFVRSFCYFYLTNLFGKVPLVTTTNWTETRNIQRAETSALNAFILSDFANAYQFLPTSYPTGTKARVSKWSAAAMLARTNLYSGNWNEALKYSSDVIANSGLFNGELPPVESVFLTASPEAIWQMPPISYWRNPFEGTAYNNFGQILYTLSEDFENIIDPQDARTSFWIDHIDDGQGGTYAVPAKYKANTYSGANTEQYMIIRMAEMILTSAESSARLGNTNEAINKLNIIRRRANLDELSALTPKEDVLSEIEKEKRIEFFSEWGHRWLDLKRLPALKGSGRRVDEVMPLNKPGNWQTTDALYPVPQKEISLNPSLAPNNPGY